MKHHTGRQECYTDDKDTRDAPDELKVCTPTVTRSLFRAKDHLNWKEFVSGLYQFEKQFLAVCLVAAFHTWKTNKRWS